MSGLNCIHGDNPSECISCSMLIRRLNNAQPEANTKADSLRAAQEPQETPGSAMNWSESVEDGNLSVVFCCPKYMPCAVHSKQSEPEPKYDTRRDEVWDAARHADKEYDGVAKESVGMTRAEYIGKRVMAVLYSEFKPALAASPSPAIELPAREHFVIDPELSPAVEPAGQAAEKEQ